jgi:hypothetical protein
MMNFLAQADRVYRWDPSWWPTGGSSLPLKWLYVIAVGLIVFVTIRFGVKYYRRLRRRLEPLRIYAQVAGKMGLSTEQRWTLWRVARQTGLTSPLTLLVCSDTLDWHGRQYVSQLSGSGARSAERQLERIATKLFSA